MARQIIAPAATGRAALALRRDTTSSADVSPNHRRALVGMCLALPVACLAAAGPASAQVTLDGTANPASRGALDGPDYRIGAELGRTEGGNLFHSFERFGLRTGESATFSGPAGIENVISRVTGGERSDIDGTLRSTIPGADLYFLNPAGVMFGPNATLDVKGSLHVSTADELRFADGEVFSAAEPAPGSRFTVAEPEAFGFLGAEPAGIAVEGSTLAVPPGEALSLVGGAVAVVGPSLAADNLRAPDGRIDLASAASPGEVAIGSDTVDTASPMRPGGIALNGASLAASGPDGGGRVVIRGGEIVIERSLVAARSLEDGDSAGVSIAGDGVRLDGGLVSTSSSGAGDAGPIAIAADRLDLRNASFVTSSSGEGSTGAGGDIAITVGALDVSGGSAIITNTFGTGPSSRAGDLTVTASEGVTVAGTGAFPDGSPTFSRLSTGVIGDDSGDGGRLTVSAPRLEVGAGGVISASTTGSGRGGDVEFAGDRLTVSAGGAIRTSTLLDPASDLTVTGPAGDLTVTAEEEVTVTGAGGPFSSASTLETSTFNTKAPAGRIAIRAPRIEVSDDAFVTALTGGPGAGGAIDLKAGRLDVTGGAAISASAQGPGDTGPAGSVTVTAGEAVTIAADGAITAFTTGSGPGGRVAIAAPRLSVAEGGGIATSTLGRTPKAGDGGPIAISVGRLEVTDGGFIQAATIGRGDAGDLTVTARESVTVAGAGSRLQASTAAAQTDPTPLPRSTGAGGTVRVEAPVVRLADGGTVTARSLGTGPAGDVVVTAPDRLVVDDASITTEATAAGGGRIAVTVGELIDLRDSEVTTSVVESGSAGNGGDIIIDPRFMVLDDSVIRANAVRGNGGDVRIEVGHLFRTPDSVIEASSQLGIDGTIAISAPDQDVTSGLVALPAAFVDASSLLRESCAARGGESAGSFVGVGKGGVAPGPEALLAGSYAGLIDAGTGAAAAVAEAPRFDPVGLVLACGGED